jgi:hypothetical protein
VCDAKASFRVLADRNASLRLCRLLIGMWAETNPFWIISSGLAVQFNSEENYERVRYIAGPATSYHSCFTRACSVRASPLL